MLGSVFEIALGIVFGFAAIATHSIPEEKNFIKRYQKQILAISAIVMFVFGGVELLMG